MNRGAEGHKGSWNVLGALGLAAGGRVWEGRSHQCFQLTVFENEVPLYELPRGDHAGEVGNECDLGKPWPEA